MKLLEEIMVSFGRNQGLQVYCLLLLLIQTWYFCFGRGVKVAGVDLQEFVLNVTGTAILWREEFTNRVSHSSFVIF